jgi:hypothetical protein
MATAAEIRRYLETVPDDMEVTMVIHTNSGPVTNKINSFQTALRPAQDIDNDIVDGPPRVVTAAFSSSYN